MKRRDLILASAGVLVPALGRSAQPCPPPLVSASGGGSAATSCPAAPSRNYFTSFGATENPILESGAWTRLTTSYWHDVRTAGGNAVPSANASADRSIFDDCYARLTGTWGPDQELIATIYKGAASEGEVELCMRVRDTSSTVALYECGFNIGGATFIARWNGGPGNYTMLAESPNGLANTGGLWNGDKVRARISGQTISMWYARASSPTNWILIGNVIDNSIQRLTSGNPGIGFFARSPLPLDYGYQDLAITQL